MDVCTCATLAKHVNVHACTNHSTEISKQVGVLLPRLLKLLTFDCKALGFRSCCGARALAIGACMQGRLLATAIYD